MFDGPDDDSQAGFPQFLQVELEGHASTLPRPKGVVSLDELLVTCVALIPSLLEICLWLLHASHGFPFGELSAIPQVLGAKMLGTIGENGFLAGIPALLACVLVPLLLSASRIPLRARMVTALAVVAALMVMFVQVTELHRQFLQGRFNFLF